MNGSWRAATGSLKRKIILPLLLLGTAGAVLAIVLTEQRAERQLAEQMHRRAELAANMVSYAAASVSHASELQRIVVAIGTEREILDVVVAAGHPARVVASTAWRDHALSDLSAVDGAEDLGAAIRTRSGGSRFDSAQHRFVFSAALRIGELASSDAALSDGAVLVRLDTRSMEAAVQQETFRQIATMLLRLIVLATLGYALLQWFVLRPLAAIGRAVTLGPQAGATDWDKAATGDEIGKLADTLRESLSRTETTLRELARERLAQANVIEGTDAGTWEWNIETGETRLNQRWAQMLGYTLQELDPTRIDTWRGLIHPEDQERSGALCERHFRRETAAYECEVRARHKDGHWVWILSRGKVFGRDASDRPLWMAGTHMDISERKHAEEALQRNNQLLSSVMESLPCGLSVFDAELNLVAANTEFCRLLDLPDSLFEGSSTTMEDVIRFNVERGEYGPCDVQAMVQSVLDRARSRNGNYQLERIRPDGTPLEIRGAMMPDGGRINTFVDLSARRRAEAAIQRSAQLLRGAMEAIDEAFVLFDPDDRLVLCNQKYREVYPEVAHLMQPGISFEALIRAGAEAGTYVDAIGRVDAWVAERVAAHRAGDRTLVQRHTNGRILRIVERKLPDGHIVGFRFDITDLVRANEAVQAASNAKSQFLANMSHEIRTPMNAILGMLELLQRTPLSERQADYAAKTEGAARSLLGLLNDILDFSKVEAGKMTLDPQSFGIAPLLRDLSVILSAGVGSKPVALRFEVDPAVPHSLVGDALRLQQVLINLGGNAIKFTAQGEVVLSIVLRARDSEAATLQIEVRDTGIGIAPEHHARIFSGFTQAEASTTRRFGGSGLGLAISRRLVALMGGELCLDSSLGRGSRFHFCLTLPIAAEAVAPAEAASDARPPHAPGLRLGTQAKRLAGVRLLLAEDNLNNQQVARELLEDEGAIVQIAHHGQEAVQALAGADAPFDVVLMDLQMPVMDGFTATRQIRAELALTLPIVAMTANAMASDRAACLAAGMNDHVGKPFDLDQLVRVLRKHTGREAQDDVPHSATAGLPGAHFAHAGTALSGALTQAAAAAHIDLHAALGRLGGKPEVYRRMLQTFVKDLAGMPEMLLGFAAQSDAGALARLLHTLKGLAATLGATALADTAALAEQQVQAACTAPASPASAADLAGAAQRVAGAIGSAAPGLEALLRALQTARDTGPLQGTMPALQVAPDQDAVVSALRAMMVQLDNSDMSATDAIVDLRQGVGAALARELEPIDSAIAALDFARARRDCEALIGELMEARA